MKEERNQAKGEQRNRIVDEHEQEKGETPTRLRVLLFTLHCR